MPAQRMEAPISVGEAVLAIESRDYLLPSIQRDFVWDAERTEKLFDSLLRGYPVGSFLFWKVLPDNLKTYRFYEFLRHVDASEDAKLKSYEIVDAKPRTIVLDGQQRLTSFYLGLLGYRADKAKWKWSNNPAAYPKRRLYLNLAKQASGGDNLDLVYDFQFLTEEQAADKTEGNFWFPVREALKWRLGADVDMQKMVGYITANALNSWGGQALAKLCNAVLKDPVIHYFQEDEQSLSKVLNIFVRLNSGGMALSYSDLLLSIASAQWQTDARETIHGLVRELNATGEGFDFDKDFVLKSALVLTDLTDIGFNVENFNKQNTAAIEEGWATNVKEPLLRATEVASALGYQGKTLTSSNVLIPVAYYLRKIGAPAQFALHPKYAEDRARIRKWLIAGLLKGVFSAKTDTLIAAVRSAIKSQPELGFPLAAIEKALLEQNVSLKFNDDEAEALLDTEYGKRNAFSVMAALYPALSSQYKFHIDHVFPRSSFHKSKLRRAGFSEQAVELMQEQVNRVANLQILEGLTNEVKLATPFDEWIAPMLQAGHEDEWSAYKTRHAIPDLSNDLPSYDMAHFGQFYVLRRALLKKRLLDVLSVGQ